MPTQNDYWMIQELHQLGMYLSDITDRLGVFPSRSGFALKRGSRQGAEGHREHPQPQTARDLDGKVLSVHCLAARELAVADSFLCLRHKTVAADP